MPRSRLLEFAFALALGAGLSPAVFGDAEGFTVSEVLDAASRLEGDRLSAECGARWTPSAALLTAGMTSSGVKPEDVQRQLDRQLAQVDATVAELHGTVRRLERVRGVRNDTEEGHGAPFVVLQTLEIELPIEAPMDAALGRLLLLGVDRFSGDLYLDRRSSRTQLVARYRLDGWDQRLRALREDCRHKAFQGWCAEHGAELGERLRPRCTELLAAMTAQFHDDSFSIGGLRLISADGGMRGPTWSWPLPQGFAEEARLASSAPADVTGSIGLSFSLRPR